MRVGVFGGSFNPIHLGHLLVAEDAFRQLRLDRLLFVPAAFPPHRSDILASFEDRLSMVRLSLAGFPAAESCDIEGRNLGPSYTVRTLELLQQQNPGASLYLMVGADQYASVGTWYKPDSLTRLAHVVVLSRPKVPPPSRFPNHAPQRVRFLDVVPVDISAATVRARLAAGRSIRCLVLSQVADYIRRRRLYRSRVVRASSRVIEDAVAYSTKLS